MSTSVEQSFVKHFQADVHLAYQRMGSKLRNTVRTKNSIKGSSTTFQKIGKGTASTKARHGKVPVMNVDHNPVECTLYDYYAGDWVDSLDELKTAHDERAVIARAGAYALGRKTDELITEQLDTSTNYAGAGSDGLTKAKVLTAFEMLGDADVPDDGERYAVVGWKQWSDLLGIEEFAHADYIGDDDLPWKGTQAKRWLGTLWMPHSGLTKTSSVRYCYWYHKTAVGHAVGSDVKTDITWHGDRAANFINKIRRLLVWCTVLDQCHNWGADCGRHWAGIGFLDDTHRAGPAGQRRVPAGCSDTLGHTPDWDHAYIIYVRVIPVLFCVWATRQLLGSRTGAQ